MCQMEPYERRIVTATVFREQEGATRPQENERKKKRGIHERLSGLSHATRTGQPSGPAGRQGRAPRQGAVRCPRQYEPEPGDGIPPPDHARESGSARGLPAGDRAELGVAHPARQRAAAGRVRLRRLDSPEKTKYAPDPFTGTTPCSGEANPPPPEKVWGRVDFFKAYSVVYGQTVGLQLIVLILSAGI